MGFSEEAQIMKSNFTTCIKSVLSNIGQLGKLKYLLMLVNPSQYILKQIEFIYLIKTLKWQFKEQENSIIVWI
jgi:hypothetical protein